MSTPRTDRPTFRLRDPDEVLTALPYLLGFRPQSSVVVLGLRRSSGELVITARTDLPETRSEADTVGSSLSAALVRAGGDRALVVVVRADPPTSDDRALLRPVLQRVRRAGVTVIGTLEVSDDDIPPGDRFEPGLPVPDLALDALVRGRQVFSRRSDVVAQVRRRPEGVAVELAAALTRVTKAAVPVEDLTRAVEAVSTTCGSDADRAGAPPALSNGDLAVLCLALRQLPLRDRMLDLVVRTPERIYDEVLLRVCRTAPDEWVAPAATVLGAAAYLRGDGVLARSAIDRALEVDPHYSLARLIEMSLDHALPPAQLRDALAACFPDSDADPPMTVVA